MSYENKPGTGALFKNEQKKSDKHPDLRGPFYESIEGETVEREISAWVRKSKKGQTYLSLQVRDKFVPSRTEAPSEEPNDDIPF